MDVSYGIHWIRASLADRSSDEICEAVGGGWSDAEPRARFNQPLTRLHESGASVHFGSRVREQPPVLDVPGETCEGYGSRPFLAAIAKLRGAVTRFDVACDVGPEDEAETRLKLMHRLFKRGKCFTRIPAKSARWHEDEADEGGLTGEYGSKASEAWMRAYTRRGPLRLEWQVMPKQSIARRGWGIMLNASPVSEVWNSYAHRIQWPLSWYRQLLLGNVIEQPSVQRVKNALAEAIEKMRMQAGTLVYAMSVMGMDLGELARTPHRPCGSMVMQLLGWAKDGEASGYDGQALRDAVERLRKGNVV